MPENFASSRPTLLVLASTYPRWSGDHEPGFVHELAKRLAAKFQVVAIVPSAPGALAHEILDGVEVIRYRYAPQRFETLVNDGGVVTNLQLHRWKAFLLPTFVLAQAWVVWRLLRTKKVEVIHAHWLLPQGLIVALLRKLSRRTPPCLVTSHGADLFALRGKFMNVLKRFVVRESAMVTVVSQAMSDEFVRIGADVGKVNVRSMGVDLTGLFTPDSLMPRSTDEILFVGRLVEKKGLLHLIDAMPAILDTHPTAYLTVAGFGPEEADRRLQVKRLGLQSKVHFVGAVPQSDLPSMYRRAAVFVAPFVQAASGDQEGLGLVAVEAAGCGCPLVVSDLPAVRGVFDAGLARFVTPGSDVSISSAVCALLSDRPTQVASEEMRASLRERFDWNAVAGCYAELLGDLTTSRPDKSVD